MSALFLRIGVVVIGAAVIGVGTLVWEWWKNHNEMQNSSHSEKHMGSFDGSGINTCYICLNDFNNFDKNKVSLPCKHKYHKECIQLLLKEPGSKKTCPVCRSVIPVSGLLL